MKGYIYKIFDNTNGNVYYGSTTQKVSQRVSEHRRHYKRYLNGTIHNCKSYDIIANGDYDYNIEEEVECESKYELHNRERWYIENNNCINKCIPNRTQKEFYEDNKDKILIHQKEYYEENKETINEKKKEHYEKNKETIKEQHKEYYEKNKDKKKKYSENNKELIKERMKEYYEKNKEKIKQKQKEYYEKINKKNIV